MPNSPKSPSLDVFRGFATAPRDATRGPRRAGLLVIASFALVFGGWSALAPLAGGAVASGRIAPDHSVRTVQHLEGGLVREIFVKEGEVVPAGAPLLALEDVASLADLEMLLDRRRARMAEAARLAAELARMDSIFFPSELRAEGADVIAAEQQIFEAHRKMRQAQKQALKQRIEQLNEQILGLRAQSASTEVQFDLIQEEIADKSALVKKGLAPKFELSRLRRTAAELEGQRGEYMASIAQARERIGETEVQLLTLDAEWVQEASQRLSEIRSELAEIDQQLTARRDVLKRTVVTAPVPGIVNNLRLKTEGGVLSPGEDILDLVPTEERFVIEVQVSPVDIDAVKVGLPAVVHLTALAGKSSPRLTGQVTAVSADLIFDEASRTSHYTAKVEVPVEESEMFSKALLTVGMPVEVIVVSEERTVIAYLLKPLVDAMRRAGREV